MISAQECDKLTIDVGCGLEIDGSNRLPVNRLHLIGDGLKAGEGSCDIAVELGCGLQLDGNAVAVDPAARASNDIGPSGFGCALETKGATCTVTVVEDVTADEDGDLVTKRNLEFVNGLLKDCDAA